MSRFDKLKEQNPKWDVSILDLIKQADPSDSNRYIGFLLKCLKNEVVSPERLLDKIFMGRTTTSLQKFHEYYEQGLISKKDINTYSDLNEINEGLREAEQKIKEREAEKQVIKLHEDDDWVILKPLTYESARSYGKGTKWCITERQHWERYVDTYFFIYIISKKRSSNKFCISKDCSNFSYGLSTLKGWLSDDTEENPMFFDIPPELFPVIVKDLKTSFHSIKGMSLLADGHYNHTPKWEPIEVPDYNDELLPFMDNDPIPDGYMTTTWRTGAGETLLIKDMTTSHLRNTIRKLGVGGGRHAYKIPIMEYWLRIKEAEERMTPIQMIST